MKELFFLSMLKMPITKKRRFIILKFFSLNYTFFFFYVYNELFFLVTRKEKTQIKNKNTHKKGKTNKQASNLSCFSLSFFFIS